MRMHLRVFIHFCDCGRDFVCGRVSAHEYLHHVYVCFNRYRIQVSHEGIYMYKLTGVEIIRTLKCFMKVWPFWKYP